MLFNEDNMKLYLIDFGSATHIEWGIYVDGKEGTLSYLSPETLNYDWSCLESDIWSLGVVLYGMLTGKFLFSGS